MDINRTTQDLHDLLDAVDNFKLHTSIMQTFGPESLPGNMACGEANAFSELFEALGMSEEADSLRVWHLADDDEEKNDAHPDWP